MVESKDVLRRATLKGVEIFNLEMIFAPFKFEARSISDQALQVWLVEQIIHSFFVDLEIGAIHSELLSPSSRLLFDHLKQKTNRSRHDTLVLASLDHSNRLSLVVRTILVTLHRECLAWACLTVSENGRVVALKNGVRNMKQKEMFTYINNLLHEVMHTTISENLALWCFMVKQYVKGSILVLVYSLVEGTSLSRKNQYRLEKC